MKLKLAKTRKQLMQAKQSSNKLATARKKLVSHLGKRGGGSLVYWLRLPKAHFCHF